MLRPDIQNGSVKWARFVAPKSLSTERICDEPQNIASKPAPVEPLRDPQLGPMLEYCLDSVNGFWPRPSGRANIVLHRLFENGYTPTSVQKFLLLTAMEYKMNFQLRGRTTPKSNLCLVTPGFWEIIWGILIMHRHLEAKLTPHASTNRNSNDTLSRTLGASNIERCPEARLPLDIPLKEGMEYRIKDTEEVLRLTEMLVRYYTFPTSTLSSLADIVSDINASPFARYMATRGLHAPAHNIRWDIEILRFWGSTSSEMMDCYIRAFHNRNAVDCEKRAKEMVTKVEELSKQQQSDDCDREQRKRLQKEIMCLEKGIEAAEENVVACEMNSTLIRHETCRALGLESHSKKEVDRAVSEGIQQVNSIRRKIVRAVRDEYEYLLAVFDTLLKSEEVGRGGRSPAAMAAPVMSKRIARFRNPIVVSDWEDCEEDFILIGQ